MEMPSVEEIIHPSRTVVIGLGETVSWGITR